MSVLNSLSIFNLSRCVSLQVCLHDGPVVDPDHRDVSPNSHSCDIVSRFIARNFKGVSTKPAVMEVCMYTVTVSVVII